MFLSCFRGLHFYSLVKCLLSLKDHCHMAILQSHSKTSRWRQMMPKRLPESSSHLKLAKFPQQGKDLEPLQEPYRNQYLSNKDQCYKKWLPLPPLLLIFCLCNSVTVLISSHMEGACPYTLSFNILKRECQLGCPKKRACVWREW